MVFLGTKMFKKLKYVSAIFGLLCSTVITAQAGELNVYNWIEYIPEGFRSGFEKETDVQVNYDTFETDESLDAKLARGKTGYDIVVPSALFAEHQIKHGRFKKIVSPLLPNRDNLDPEIMRVLAQIDPGNQYLVPWSWGYTGIGVNEVAVKKALGAEPMPNDPFELIFNPKYTRKLKSCGIFMLDTPIEILPVALHYLGRRPNSDDPQDYADVLKQVLLPIRSDIRRFGDSSVVYDVAEGKYCVTLAWAADIGMASKISNNRNIKMLQGKHSMLFVDVMAIPVDAKNVTEAHQWMNYSLRPEVAATMVTDLGYATPNRAAKPLLKKYEKEMGFFPGDEHIARMYLRRLPATRQGVDAMNRAFRAFKLGRSKS